MTTNFTLRSQETTPQQARNARRVALLVLLVTAPSLVVFGFLSYQLGAWQMITDTVILFANGVAAFVGLMLIQRGRVILGMQIILAGIGLGLLALNLLLAGLGVMLGVAVSLLITAIASLTLPESMANPIMVAAFGLGLFIVLLDAILPAYRLSVPQLNAYVPLIILFFAVPCVYFIARQFGTYSMRGKLTLTLLLVAILPVVIQAVAFGVLAESNLRASAQQTLLAAGTQTAGRIDQFIRDGLLDIRASARLPEVVDFLSAAPDQRKPTQLAPILNALSSKNVYIRSYAVYDLHGITLFDTAQLNIGTDQLNQPYVREPLQTSQPYASDVLFDPITDEGLIHFSAPVVRTGSDEVIGVARVAYSIIALQDLVAQAMNLGGSDSFGILLDENHFMLAGESASVSSIKSVVPLPSERLAVLRTDRRIPDIDDAELSTNLPELDAGLALADTQPFFDAEAHHAGGGADQGDHDQMAVVRLNRHPNWLMAFGRPQQAFLGPVNDLAHSSLFLVLAISAITIFAADRFSRLLAQPIVSLNETAARIAQGDLTAQAVVETNDEVGALATTFNNMTRQLHTLITSLEDQVRARTGQLRASAEVGRAATSILDVDQLLHEAVNLISDRFGFYYAAIFTLDYTGRVAILREATGEAGRVLKARGHQLEVNAPSMVGTAITTRRARIALAERVGDETVRFANPLLPDTRSEIALPLNVGERTIGALDVQSVQADAFDETNAAVLQSMADQIAIALNNAALHTESQNNIDALNNLLALTQDIASSRNLPELIQRASRSFETMLGSNDYYLALVDEQQANLHFIMRRRPGQPLDEEVMTRPMGKRRSDFVVRNRQVLRMSTAEAPLRLAALGIITSTTKPTAFLGVPIMAGGRALGMLAAQDEQPTAVFTDQQERLAQALADQLAITLENLRLTQSTQAALADLDAANRRLIGQAWEHYTRTTDVIQGEWRDGRWLTHQNAPTAAPDGHGLRLPLKVRGETIGEFGIHSLDAQRDWTSDDIAFAQALIDQVGQVIENARLLEETERFAQREQRIRQITNRIRAAGDVQAVLEATTTELARSLGVSRAIMRLTMGDASSAAKPAITDGQPRLAPETAA
ncbi:MAG: GAF domain-containing protein [Chloroflexi bacterium]|nr:GAF domain-containing protein [Chloroflexota bacterium]